MKKNNWMKMILLCGMLLLSNLTFIRAAETQYVPEDAIEYSQANWDSEVGVCDEFVKECLKAGGIEILAGGVEPLMNALEDAGYGKIISLQLDENGQYINKSDNPELEAGDPLFIYCNQCEKWMHTMIVTGFDGNGNVLADGHNPSWTGIFAFGHFTHATDDGGQHSSDCKFAAVHMDTSHLTCNHQFVSDLYETAHPHTMYAECKFCDTRYDLGWNANQITICWECFPPLGDKPVVTAQANSDETAIMLSWSTVVDAQSFNVYRSKNGTTYYKLNTNPIYATSFTNKNFDKGQYYYYKVEAVTSSNTIESEPVKIIVETGEPLTAPVIELQFNAAVDEKPVITWDICSGAVNYEVHRSTTSETAGFTKVFETAGTTYTHTSFEKGVTYYYKVKAVFDNGTELFSNVVQAYAAKQEQSNPDDSDVTRIMGETRYQTSLEIADSLKEELGVDKFDTVILSSGKGYADALAGSYLAAVKNAPIIMVNPGAKNYNDIKAYLAENLVSGGKVYILGGTAAVPSKIESALTGYAVHRLAGSDRFKTNLEILNEAGVTNEPILVCYGRNFADSLSASATGLPMLLVEKNKLNAEQKAFLEAHSGNKIYVLGGTAAVSAAVEKELKNYGTVERIAGSSRYSTSIEIAKKFFPEAESAVLAYAQNFPDGLCGGPLAYATNSPLILTDTKNAKSAAAYTASQNIQSGAVLGGPGLISDEATDKILGSIPEMK